MLEIDRIYVALEGYLTNGWIPGRTVGRRCFSLKNHPVSDEIQKLTATDIYAQFWKNQGSKIGFEFASDPKHKDQRERLAASFRSFIFSGITPPWVENANGSTVVRLSGHFFEVDPDEAILQFYLFVSQKFGQWVCDILPVLLTEDLGARTGGTECAMWRTALRMARSSRNTAAYANGQEVDVSQRVKEKECRFSTDEEEAAYLMELLQEQGWRCALTGLQLEPDEDVLDRELTPSLDRIDSDGHYERGNLQVVCWFANRWKGSMGDAKFRQLIELVRSRRAEGKGMTSAPSEQITPDFSGAN